jgi:hypothetical protein
VPEVSQESEPPMPLSVDGGDFQNKESTLWQSQRIRLASITIRQPLTTTLPLTITIKPPIIMTWASTKTPKSMPTRLWNTVKPATNTLRPRTVIRKSDG